MNISETFIRRPIATSLLMAAIALFGVVAYRALPISDLPAVEYPTINVSANLPGGDPVIMAASVASPLERQFTTIAGVDEMTSRSGTGSANITLTFDLNRNIDSAITDVQTAISAALPLLPPTLTAPPSFRKMNPADQPILQINLTSDTLDMSKVDEYAEDIIAPRISMVDGVSQVNVNGSAKYAVRVQVDPEKLQAQKLGINEIDTALSNWNVTQPTGQLFGPDSTYSIQAKGQLNDADEFRRIIVGYRGGRPIRLDQVANVIDSVQSLTQRAWYVTKDAQLRAITLQVQKQPGTNVIEVADAVRAVLPGLEAQLPPSVHLSIRQDRSVNIRQAFSDVRLTMLITLVLVVGVIYLFLHNGSATVIPALALPFSILGTFAVMQVMHYSLDNLSMMAIILSVGFIVDDAIVMLENAVRHMEAGESALEAALKGSREIGFTIVTMTVSLAAVFIPLLFMGGILGRLFREFAVTITAAVLISGLVSITLTPMLCSRFLRVVRAKRSVLARLDRGFDRLRGGYGWSLRWVLGHRRVLMVVFLAVIAATVAMYGVVPKGFIPDTDNDSLNINIQAAQGTSYYESVNYSQKVIDVVRQTPYVEAQMVNVGGGGPGGSFNVQLTPRARRPVSAQQIAQQLRGPVGRFPGFKVTVNVPSSLQIGGFRGNSNYNINVQSLNYDDLFTWAPRLEAAMAEVPEVQDVSDNMDLKSPRVSMTIDRDKAAALGLSATQITNTLSDGFGQRLVGTIYGERTQFRVLLEIDPKYQERPESLHRISFKTPQGGLVPLEQVMNIKEDVGPQSVNHFGQLPAVGVSFSLKPGASLGAALDHITAAAKRVLPATVTTSLQGSAKVFQESLSNLSLLFFIAVGVVYIVLGMLYESYIHPITILSGLPSAALGGLVTLWLFGNELNIYSFVGLILLIGLVMKNAIMQIDFALDAERQRDLTPTEAIYEGCIVRFRPIMMTRMAALLGAVPIALGFGAGGEARRPLGLAVVGGLVVSQVITLYLTPVVYTFMSTWVKTRKISVVSGEALAGERT
ncbi:MAG TPA: efflux RND transporter permease subunit [Vicinamibacterales bacterium]|nr:efflux RND transporter permease subunit [Vicinamibacterales bacterium]